MGQEKPNNNKREGRTSHNTKLPGYVQDATYEEEFYMRAVKILLTLLAVLLGVTLIAGIAMAEEKVLVKGKIVSYDLDARTLTIKADSGEQMTFEVENDVALGKLDDRLFVDDEVKVKYVNEDGKLVIKDSSDLKGTKPGC